MEHLLQSLPKWRFSIVKGIQRSECMVFHIPRCATRVCFHFFHDRMPFFETGMSFLFQVPQHAYPVNPRQGGSQRRVWSFFHFFPSFQPSQKSYSEQVSSILNLLMTREVAQLKHPSPWPVPVMAPMMVPVRPGPERRWSLQLTL